MEDATPLERYESFRLKASADIRHDAARDLAFMQRELPRAIELGNGPAWITTMARLRDAVR
jgi:hypothetical protein